MKTNMSNILEKFNDDYYLAIKTYNNKGYNEVIDWKNKNNHDGSVYGLFKQISDKVEYRSKIYVIDMNIDLKKVMGIGLILNDIYYNKQLIIHSDEKRNMHIYKSKFYKNRDILLKIENGEYIINFLDELLFKKNKCYIMGNGIRIINNEKIKYDYIVEPRVKRYVCSKCGEIKRPNGIRPNILHKNICRGYKLDKKKKSKIKKKILKNDRFDIFIRFIDNLFEIK